MKYLFLSVLSSKLFLVVINMITALCYTFIGLVGLALGSDPGKYILVDPLASQMTLALSLSFITFPFWAVAMTLHCRSLMRRMEKG